MSVTTLTAKALRKAADIRERMDALQEELNAILGGAVPTPAKKQPKQRKFSAAARAKMRRAQKARWARTRGRVLVAGSQAQPRSKAIRSRRAKRMGRRVTMVRVEPASKAKSRFSPAAKARLSALAKERWAKAKAQGKAKL